MGLNIGGAETHLVDVVKDLSSKYDLIVASNDGTYVKELEKHNIKHYKISFHSKNPFQVLSSMRKLRKIIREEKVDILHSHARIPSFIGGIVSKREKIHFVTTTHGHFKVNALLKKLSNWGDYSIAVSKDLKDYLIKEYNFNKDKISLSINGINTDVFKTDDKEKKDKIIHVSRLDKETSKVAEILIRQAKNIYEQSGLQIKIVGDGTEFLRLKELAKNVDPKGEYLILNGKSAEVYKDLRSAAIFIGVSRSLLEAMCYEIPVILAGDVGYAGLLTKENVSEYEDTNFSGRKLQQIVEGDFIHDILKACTLKDSFSWTREYILEKYAIKNMLAPYYALYDKILSQSKKYLISGYYGYKNSGDDALLASVVKDIKEVNKENTINILSKKGSYYDFSDVHFTDRFNLIELIKAIKNTDILIMGGGSLLQDKTSNRSLYYYLSVMKIASIFKKRVYLYANGIGPINKKRNIFFSKRILNKVFVITFRDPDSYEFVKSIGVKRPYMFVTADSVFSLESDFRPVKKVEEKVAFVIRDWDHSEAFCKELAKFADYIIENYHLSVVFVPLKLEDDEEISKDIMALMKHSADIVLLNNEKALIDFFSTCYFTVCMRFHGVIYSSIASSPAVGLSYDKKVSSICRELGLDFIKTEDIRFEDLVTMAEGIVQDYEEKKNIINKNVIKLKEKAKINKAILYKI